MSGLNEEVRVINVGIESFYNDLKSFKTSASGISFKVCIVWSLGLDGSLPISTNVSKSIFFIGLSSNIILKALSFHLYSLCHLLQPFLVLYPCSKNPAR